jgi:hypothetical protein
MLAEESVSKKADWTGVKRSEGYKLTRAAWDQKQMDSLKEAQDTASERVRAADKSGTGSGSQGDGRNSEGHGKGHQASQSQRPEPEDTLTRRCPVCGGDLPPQGPCPLCISPGDGVG